MEKKTSQEIRSKVTNDGYMEISIIESPIPKPQENEVLVRMEAAPINPSDLGKLLSHAADLSISKLLEIDKTLKLKLS